MTTGDETAPAADLNVLAALVGDDPAVIDEIVQSFRDSAARTSQDLDEAARIGSLRAVADAGHKLKSAARAIGALRLGAICDEIEQVAQAGRIVELGKLLPLFHIELDAVYRFLDSR